jgi:hypothetical protein
MLRDLSLNPVDDPDDIPSVIALCDEEDDAEDLATVADLERDVEVVSRWIADEEAKAEERRRRLEAIRDDISSETHTETRTAGDGARDAVSLPLAREMALAKLRRRKLVAELEATRARARLSRLRRWSATRWSLLGARARCRRRWIACSCTSACVRLLETAAVSPATPTGGSSSTPTATSAVWGSGTRGA